MRAGEQRVNKEMEGAAESSIERLGLDRIFCYFTARHAAFFACSPPSLSFLSAWLGRSIVPSRSAHLRHFQATTTPAHSITNHSEPHQ